jgi:hydrogenase maturation protease
LTEVPMKTRHGRTLVLGLGNTILSDDGAGCYVAMSLKDRLEAPEVDVMEASIAGLDFLDLLTGYDKAIIIDAIQTGEGAPGRIFRLAPDVLAGTRHAGTPHDVNLVTALELGKRLGLQLPREITIFAIEAKDVVSFGETCTPEVKKAISACVEMVIEEIKGDGIVPSGDAVLS